MLVVPEPHTDEGPPPQGVFEVEGTAEDLVDGGEEGDREVESRWKIRDLLADERCSQAVLDFLSTTDVGRLVPLGKNGTRGAKCRSGSSGSAGNGK